MARWESIRRPDWLKELQAVLVLGVVIVGLSGVLGVAAVAGDSVRLDLPASGVSGAVDHPLREQAAIAAEQDVTVTVHDPTLEQRAAWLLTALPSYSVVAVLLVLLLRIVWLARRADPFTLAAVRRLRVLAVVALVGGYLGFLVEMAAGMYLSSTVLVDGAVGFSELPLHWFLVGFGLFAVAEVVKRGYAMRAELETVV